MRVAVLWACALAALLAQSALTALDLRGASAVPAPDLWAACVAGIALQARRDTVALDLLWLVLVRSALTLEPLPVVVLVGLGGGLALASVRDALFRTNARVRAGAAAGIAALLAAATGTAAGVPAGSAAWWGLGSAAMTALAAPLWVAFMVRLPALDLEEDRWTVAA